MTREPNVLAEHDSTTRPAIRSVHTITTGHAEQHPEHRYGTRLPLMWWVLTSRRWVRIPLNAYLVEHREGLVLFDTGLDPSIVSDPGYIDSPIGRFLLHRIFRLHIGPEDALEVRLSALGFSATDVHTAVISHMHFDHIGGIGQIPQADLLVSKTEWRRLSQPHPERDWILREHIELDGARWRQIEFTPSDDPMLSSFGGSHDVFGDGTLVLLPTPGHTPGSLSMLVRDIDRPPLLFVGDLTYSLDLLLEDKVPGVGDPVQLRNSFARVRGLMEAIPDLLVLSAHDLEAAAVLERGWECRSDW